MMKYYSFAALCVLAAACSKQTPADDPSSASYEASADTTSTDENLRPASSDSLDTTSSSEANKDSGTWGGGEKSHSSTTSGPMIAPSPGSSPATATPRDADAKPVAPNNTGVNERDRDASAKTPLDQGQGKGDIDITAQIRRAVMGEDTLSFDAKNVKIITENGRVTLRGPVKSADERSRIEAMARKVAGAGKVDNQLEVK